MKRLAPLAGIFALGLLLRLYQLGADGFWVDELGVAQAALAPNPGAALSIVRTHVMAMPLDYLVAWGVGRFSAAEFFLRLPAALWGALTIPAACALYRPLIGKNAARWGILLLALSPALIKYSQELRFYAALVFFYTLTTALGLQALRSRKPTAWLMFWLSGAVGIFFHLYVALAWLNVAAFGLLRRRKNPLRWLTASFLIFFLAATAGVALFGALPGERGALFTFENPSAFLLGGLGFLPPMPAAPPLAYIFGFVLLMAFLASAALSPALGWLTLSLFLQIGLILGLDAWRGYFAASRQLLPLLPLTFPFAARVFAAMQKHLPPRLTPAAPLLALTLAALVLLPYYHAEKTSTRAILQKLAQNWQPGQAVWVTPSYNLAVYAYYAPWLAADLHPFDGDELPVEQAAYLLSDPSFRAPAPFHPLFQAAPTVFYPQNLWGK
ncbi:MAG: hypothetical protein Fur0035_22580 [Anaerolineales bacterium]